jgi:hypothetical protein
MYCKNSLIATDCKPSRFERHKSHDMTLSLLFATLRLPRHTEWQRFQGHLLHGTDPLENLCPPFALSLKPVRARLLVLCTTWIRYVRLPAQGRVQCKFGTRTGCRPRDVDDILHVAHDNSR